MQESEKIKLENFIEDVGKHKGRHTELVTVYVPAGYNLNNVTRQIEQEKSTASNIKSKNTRKAVLDSLEKIERQLKLIGRTPENGLAVFAGNISPTEGVEQIELWTIEPPMPLKARLYRCDQDFVLEPLKEMLEVGELYGLLVIDRKDATIGLLEGKQIKVLRKLTSGVPSKVRAGGQCLSPKMLVESKQGTKKISNINTDEEIKAFDIKNNKIIFTKIKGKWKNNKKGIAIKVKDCLPIIASPDHTFFKVKGNKIIKALAKDLQVNNELISFNQNNKPFTIEIKEIINTNKKIEMIDIETEAKNFFANGVLVHNSSQRFHRITEGLAKEFFRRVADNMKEIFFDMPKLKGILVGGPIPTKEEFLEQGNLATTLKEKVVAVKDLGYVDEHGLKLLVEASSEDLAEQEIIKEKKLLENFFNVLAKNPSRTAYGLNEVKNALKRGAVEILILSKKLAKEHIIEMTKMAEDIAAKVEIVSVETPEGEQFYSITKGFGAILRFVI